MPQYRCSYNMVLQQQGWSYTFYRSAGSANDALTSCINPAILNALLACHNPSVYLQSVNVAQVPTQENPIVPREASRKVVMQAGSGGVSNNMTPDVTSTSVLCSLFSADGHSRPLYLRGLPDAWTLRSSGTGIMALHAGLVANLQALIGQKPAVAGSGILTTEGFQLRYLVPPSQALGAWKDVVDIAKTAGGARSIITTQGAHGWTAGQNVLTSIRDTVADAAYKGEFRILDVPAVDKITVAAAYRYDDDPHAPQLMRVRRAAPVFVNLVGGEPVSLRHRDTGRPVNLTRGRETGVSARRV